MQRLKTPWLLIPIVALAVAVGVLFPRGGNVEPALAGTVLPGIPAPNFTLRDQFGSPIRLSQFRGHPVILTFLEANCRELCPLIAEGIHRSLQELGTASKNVIVLALSTAPEQDTSSAVAAFSRAHGLFYRWHYLSGTRSAVAPVWRAYHIFAAPANAPPKLRDSHSGASYLIDPQGKERVLIGGDPDGAVLRRDLLILSGLPVAYRGPRGIPAPEPGHPAPGFALAGLHGGALHLSAFRGQVVLLNFWATWCKPCKEELPRLSTWSRRLRSRGFTVIGIDQQESRSDVAAFTHALRLPYPIALDSDGNVAARYNVTGTPTSILIDRAGTVIETHLGTVGDEYLATHVEPLVKS